jgi:hypothetical protein
MICHWNGAKFKFSHIFIVCTLNMDIIQSRVSPIEYVYKMYNASYA